MNSEYIVVVYTSILLSNNIMYAWWCFAFSLWDLEKKMLCQKISGQTWPFLCGMNIHQKVTIDEKLFWQNTNKYCCDTAHCPRVMHTYLYYIFIQKAYLMFSWNIFQNSAKLGPDDSTDSGNSISPAFKYFKMKWLFTRDFEIVTLTIPTLFLGPHTYHCQKFVFTNFCTLSLNVVEINWWARDLFLQLLFPPKKR